MTHVVWRGPELKSLVHDRAMTRLHRVGEEVLGKAIERVPLATSNLASTGDMVDVPSKLAVAVFFTGPYAVKQHEDMTLRHPDPNNPLSAMGRTAKYLEIPVNEADLSGVFGGLI